MSEQLIIRLASEAEQQIHWLIWSASEKEIIGSGEVENAQALEQLTEKSQTRQVICLVPNVDVTLKSVEITGSFNKQMQQALPYMLEDDLASDVEQLHFSVYEKSSDAVHVAICFKSKMQEWLNWLEAAQITCYRLLPEALAMPISEDSWQAIQLDQQWLIREDAVNAWSCDTDMLSTLLQLRLQENPEQLIESYSPVPSDCVGQWQVKDAVLPMQLLAEGCLDNRINLLTGEFKVKKESQLQLTQWKFPAIAAVLLLVISFAHLFIQIQQTEQQIAVVKKQVESVYQQAFPRESKLKYSRIKKKLDGMLSEITEGEPDSGFLNMLTALTPVFKSVPSLQVASLKYNGKKQELNLAVSADSFQAFELLSEKVPAGYEMEKGTLSNSKNRVSGSLIVRKR